MDPDVDRHRPLTANTVGGRALLGMAVVSVAFLGYFFVYPLATILVTGLTGDAGAVAPIRDVLTSPTFGKVAWFTVWQAVASTVLTLVIALPGAYVFARFEFPGKRVLRAAVTIPFVLPTVVVGAAFLALLGPGSPVGLDLSRTVWAILIAHVFFNYAVVVRTVSTLWEHLDPTLEDAARTLGASRWTAFTRVTLPMLRPAVLAASAIVFLFTFTSFGVILILGGLRHSTIEVEIWRQTTAFLDLPTAAVLAVVQLVGVITVLLAYARYQQRRTSEQPLRPASEVARRPRGRRESLLVGSNLVLMALLLGAPLAVLIERSFNSAGGYGLEYYRALGDGSGSGLFVDPVEAVGNSVRYAIAATFIATAIGLMAAAVIAYRRGRTSQWFDALLMLPLGTSAVTLGLGFLVALDEPVDLRTSALLIPIAHALVAIPFVVRTAVPVMRSVRHRLREAAAVLGATPAQSWRAVDLPIVSRAAMVGAAFAFAVSLGEFGATAFIARPDSPTLPIAIFRMLGRPGDLNFGRAMALSTILMVLTASAVMLIERFRVGRLGDF